ERVELVMVTLAAADRQTEPDRSGRVDAVDDRFHTELLGIDAALFVDLRVAVKTGRHFLLERSARQEVAGQLFAGELVAGQITVERLNDPVAVRPNGARRINAVAVGIRIPSQV